VVCHDRALRCFDTHGDTVFNQNFGGWGVGECRELATCDGFVNEIAGYFLRSRCDKARLWVPHSSLDLIFLKKREFFFRFSRGDHVSLGAKCLTRAHLTNELEHAVVVVFPSDFQAANFNVVPTFFVELTAVLTRPNSKLIVRGHVAEIRGMRRRSDVRWNG